MCPPCMGPPQVKFKVVGFLTPAQRQMAGYGLAAAVGLLSLSRARL